MLCDTVRYNHYSDDNKNIKNLEHQRPDHKNRKRKVNSSPNHKTTKIMVIIYDNNMVIQMY